MLERVGSAPPILATAIVRSARQYQAAMWVADDDPSQAWLHLVGAVETAAGIRPVDDAPDIERLREAWPEIVFALEPATDEVRDRVASLLAPTVRAQAKFMAFLRRYGPDRPVPRPPDWAAIDWDAADSIFRLVYYRRSKALHEATPFPIPMCEPPEVFKDFEGALSERPDGNATGALGSVWLAKDAPILLSTFEYICRHALLRWALEDGSSQPSSPNSGIGVD